MCINSDEGKDLEPFNSTKPVPITEALPSLSEVFGLLLSEERVIASSKVVFGQETADSAHPCTMQVQGIQVFSLTQQDLAASSKELQNLANNVDKLWGICMGVNSQCVGSRWKKYNLVVVQSLSHLILCDPMNYSTPSFPVLHYLPQFGQIHVHWVTHAIQP